VKLASFYDQDHVNLGAVSGEMIIDLLSAADDYVRTTGESMPLDPFVSMASFLSTPKAIELAAVLVDWVAGKGREAYQYPLAEVDFAPPLAKPGKIVCVGLNYADHCREQNVPEPESPLLFAKFPTALTHHEGLVSWPAELSQKVDYEAELAVIIGKKATNVPEAEAMDYVAAYTTANDVSARDVQFADGQWTRGKSFDTFAPMGPFVVTADAIPDPHNLAIKCRVNGETLQASNTYELIFKIPYLISFISRTCTLLPGDIISTGTPNGVGVFMDPPRFLKSGDVMEVEIEGIGVLRNKIA